MAGVEEEHRHMDSQDEFQMQAEGTKYQRNRHRKAYVNNSIATIRSKKKNQAIREGLEPNRCEI